MNQQESYYDILGVSQQSSKEQIMGKFQLESFKRLSHCKEIIRWFTTMNYNKILHRS